MVIPPNNKIYKQCSFGCYMGKYSSRFLNKVWAFRLTTYSLDGCCISYIAREKNIVCIFFTFSHTKKSHTGIRSYIAFQTTAQSVIWVDADIRLTVKTTVQRL